MSRKDGFDLAQLDAEAADLHLIVDATDELDLAVGAPAREISRAVHERPGLAMEWIRKEALGGELGPIEVAARYPDATDVELAGHTDGDRFEYLVKEVDPDVRQRPANQRRQRPVAVFDIGRNDGGFGRSISVEEAASARPAGGQLD